jgi:hypothetical protein
VIKDESTASRQKLALGSDRDTAIRSLMPRIMGGLRHCGRALRTDAYTVLVANSNKFHIRLRVENHYVYITVYHHTQRDVFSARLYSDGSGTSFDRKLYIISWNRSVEARNWQAELFEAFSEDSDWLIDLHEKPIRPEVVMAALAHVAYQ